MRLIRPLLVALALLQSARGEDPHEKKPAANANAVERTPEAVEAGRRLFQASCAGCHGQNGEGGRGPKLNRGDLIHGGTDEGLFSTITHGIKGTSMPPFSFTEPEVRTLVAFIRSLSAPAVESPVYGDAAAGRDLFSKSGCGHCHNILGTGGLLGPDLSNIGAARPLGQIRKALAHATVAQGSTYRPVRITLRSGKTIDGVLRNSNNYSLQILTAGGELIMLDASDVREIVARKEALAPIAKLTPGAEENILAFLARQTVRTPPAEEKK